MSTWNPPYALSHSPPMPEGEKGGSVLPSRTWKGARAVAIREHPSATTEIRPMSVRTALRRLDAAQKPGRGVPAYTRWVNRRLARVATAVAQRVGITPNALSFTSFLVSLAGIACLVSLGSESPLLAGALAAGLLAAGYVLDSADGQLARLTGRQSAAGEWLDHTLDSVRLPAVHLGVLWAAVLVDRPELAIVAGIFAITSSAHFFSQNLGGLLRDAGSARRHDTAPMQSWVLLPTDPGALYWLLALWAWHDAFVAAYIGLFACNAIHACAAATRRWRELATIDKEQR